MSGQGSDLLDDEERRAMREHHERFVRRLQKIARQALLSGRYGKRRRQRAQGVAFGRHLRRHVARWFLAEALSHHQEGA